MSKENGEDVMKESIGWSYFAKKRNCKDGGYSYFNGTDEELYALIRDNWDSRKAGSGMVEIDDVCIVSVPPTGFHCPLVRVDKSYDFQADVDRRREDEELHVKVTAKGQAIPAQFVEIVMYSAEALEAEGEARAGNYDWEIISIAASPVEDEPMHPLTMARNQLGKEGGSDREYTSKEWATSVWYWSQYLMRRV